MIKKLHYKKGTFIFERPWEKQLKKNKKMGRQEKRPKPWNKTGRFQLKQIVLYEKDGVRPLAEICQTFLF